MTLHSQPYWVHLVHGLRQLNWHLCCHLCIIYVLFPAKNLLYNQIVISSYCYHHHNHHLLQSCGTIVMAWLQRRYTDALIAVAKGRALTVPCRQPLAYPMCCCASKSCVFNMNVSWTVHEGVLGLRAHHAPRGRVCNTDNIGEDKQRSLKCNKYCT